VQSFCRVEEKRKEALKELEEVKRLRMLAIKVRKQLTYYQP